VIQLCVDLQYDCKKTDEEVSRRMSENRTSYNQLLIESLLTPPQNLCGAAVHVENAITYVTLLLAQLFTLEL